jgi:polyphosphate glucokinase
VTLGNDADVAGLAEMRFGAGREQMGTVMIFTLGTGIGSAVFVNGRIVPNTELGHVFLRNQKKDAESYAAERIRDEKNLTWKQWGKRLRCLL